MAVKLYRFFSGDRSGRVAWLLREMGVDFEPVELDGRTGEHLEGDYKAISPAGKIPAVVDGETVLFESGAALQYLADRYGAGEVAPPVDSELRAEYLSWLFFASATFDPVVFEFVRPDMPEELRPARQKRASEETPRLLDAVERQLDGRMTVLESGFTAADIQITGALDYARQGGCLEERSHLRDYLEAMKSRPAARAVEAFVTF